MKNNLRNLMILMLCTFLISYLSKKLLFTDELLMTYFEETVGKDKMEEFIIKMDKFQYLNYIFMLILKVLQITLVASFIYLGLFFLNLKVRYSEVFGVAIIAEFVYLLPMLIQLLWFALFETSFTLKDLQQFHPLSAINLFEYDTLEKYWRYPLLKISIFELLYWFALAYGVSKVIKQNLSEGMKIVLSSYVPALVLWMVFIVFMSIQ